MAGKVGVSLFSEAVNARREVCLCPADSAVHQRHVRRGSAWSVGSCIQVFEVERSARDPLHHKVVTSGKEVFASCIPKCQVASAELEPSTRKLLSLQWSQLCWKGVPARGTWWQDEGAGQEAMWMGWHCALAAVRE